MEDVARLIDALESVVNDPFRLELLASALWYDTDALKVDMLALINSATF